MGVKSCRRYCCENIMCDTYIPRIGYICFECQREFKKYLESKSIVLNTESDILDHLIIFMQIEKNNYNYESKISIDKFFNEHTF